MTDDLRTTLANVLHDMYGCRVTCRGGRLADDRHPSHTEAYLYTAERVLAGIDSAMAAEHPDCKDYCDCYRRGWTVANDEWEANR